MRCVAKGQTQIGFPGEGDLNGKDPVPLLVGMRVGVFSV
jgi:hypothetical protein